MQILYLICYYKGLQVHHVYWNRIKVGVCGGTWKSPWIWCSLKTRNPEFVKSCAVSGWLCAAPAAIKSFDMLSNRVTKVYFSQGPWSLQSDLNSFSGTFQHGLVCELVLRGWYWRGCAVQNILNTHCTCIDSVYTRSLKSTAAKKWPIYLVLIHLKCQKEVE